MKISTGSFICENVLVDPFMANLKAIVVLEPARHLLRAQVQAYQDFDQSPGRGIDERFSLTTSAQCQFMGLFRPVSFQPTIASQFSTNRGFMNPDKVCNFG
jgi:hypothetical protein